MSIVEKRTMNKDKIMKALTLLHLNSDMNTKETEAIELLEQALGLTTKFYKGQPVLVKFHAGDIRKGWFSHMEFENYMVYFDRGKDTYQYDNCKPDLKAESLPNWIEHDNTAFLPEVPENSMTLVIFKEGSDAHSDFPNGLMRIDPYGVNGTPVARYAVIPLPEFLD
jgi:hypothetical protein